VVKACVEEGTNYVDITGEIPWVEKMQQRYGAAALEKGVSVVSCAGYDSVPPDLTAWLAAKSVASAGGRLGRFEVFCGGGGGAMPTGTINTVLDGLDQAKDRAKSAATFGLLGSSAKPKSAATEDSAVATPDTKYVPQEEKANCSRNLFWSMLPGYSSLAGHFCIPHFMAPINVNVVHHTAASEGYGGLVYRERMAGLPNGPLSLYGLIPTAISAGVVLILACLAPLPYFSTAVRKLRDTFNTAGQQRVRDLVFAGFKPTGKTLAQGYGVSQDSKTRVKVELSSPYDPGLGFTMLSACTVSSELARRYGTPRAGKSGYCSAVVALGGDSLAEALRAQGVKLQVSKL